MKVSRHLAVILLAFGLGSGCEDVSSSKPSPDTLDGLVSLGQSALKSGRTGKAREYFEKASKIAPGSARVHTLLGMTHRFANAKLPNPESQSLELASFSKAAELNPSDPIAQVNLGSSFFFQGDQKQATSCFEKAAAAERALAWKDEVTEILKPEQAQDSAGTSPPENPTDENQGSKTPEEKPKSQIE